MSPKPTQFIREREGYYWVLAEFESESAPGKFHEVRTSQRDGVTYCTCRGWVAALQHKRKTGQKGDAICKHISEFKIRKPAEPIVIMNFEQFAAAKRVGLTEKVKAMSDEVKVRRSSC
jgi:hypothetical protein